MKQMTTEQTKSYRTLPENWREVALNSKSVATRAIASAFAMLVDAGDDAIAPTKRDGTLNVSASIADIKYNVGYHSRERAEFIIANSPALTRKLFNGEETRKLERCHDELRVKLDRDEHIEPIAVDRIKTTATFFEMKYELVSMLTNSDLEKVIKYAGARLHPENTETGNEAQFIRLNELWGKIKEMETANKAACGA